MMRWAVLFLTLFGSAVFAQSGVQSGAPSGAQTDYAQDARAAAERLDQAALSLGNAKGARDRVKALSETLRAYEDGLGAMREGLRRASIREQRILRELQAREGEIAQLLGVLQGLERTPTPVMLLHPDGPMGTARAGMILADVAPALTRKADELRAKLDEVTTLRQLQQGAVATLQKGLNGVQEARAALSQAVADRVDLPRRFTENAVKTGILIASTETLEGFASGLSEIADNEIAGSLPDISHRLGNLVLPVQGRILYRAGEADAAGIRRPGIVMVTRPRALVTTPAAATIRYRGPLLDYGNVMILEPQSDMLLVIAGLDVVYGNIGEVLPSGAPIGLMGGQEAEIGAIVQQVSAIATGNERSETLYIEVRQGNTPVDPETWFKTPEDG